MTAECRQKSQRFAVPNEFKVLFRSICIFLMKMFSVPNVDLPTIMTAYETHAK